MLHNGQSSMLLSYVWTVSEIYIPLTNNESPVVFLPDMVIPGKFVVHGCRDYFTHEGGRNTVEFFKENLNGDGLFLALKFESRSIAKDILNRLLLLLLACAFKCFNYLSHFIGLCAEL